MDAREEILKNIRTALGKSQPTAQGPCSTETAESEVATAQADVLKKYEEGHERLIAQFQEELTRVGGKFFIAKTREALSEHVQTLALKNSVQSAVLWRSAALEFIGEALNEIGVEATRDSFEHKDREQDARQRQDLRSRFIEAEMGVTAVDYALADSGSLVLIAGTGQARSISLLPPVHVAILRARQIVSGLPYVLGLLKPELDAGKDLSCCITLITGPSRTGDIEQKLTVGVHGPRELHVILDETGNVE